ncbi:MAG: putative toxin-antitoxin system toxin component, PIN family [Deltaproteobacteria bacterium]|nr:putative toxin-antitoxin system toxin component, PIN family [Deltaproteobacteria bacterium]
MPALKAVLDTNVLIGLAFARRGITKTLRELLAEEAFTVVTAADLLAELYRVFHYPRIRQRFHPTEEDIIAFLGLVLERAVIVPGRYQVQRVESDPTDDMFLACALEGKADYIVSRDPHLLNLKHFHSIQIVEPPAFVRAVRQQQRHKE